MAQVREEPRLRALLEAGIALTSELSLDAVLQRLVETAASLTGARYAALGVIDAAGRELERFVTTGIDQATHEAIGDLPRGRGILGVLIRDAAPLRIADLSEDPRSVGFPPNHPPMKTFLGVPVLLRGVAFGNLYLTEKEGGGKFTREDEEIVMLLGAQAAVAVENARLYESATRWSRQLEYLNEIGNALASELELPALLELIAARLRELVGARLVLIAVPDDDRRRLRFVSADGAGEEDVIGQTVDIAESKAGRVFQRKRSERVDSIVDDPEADQATARRLGLTTALYVPLIVRDRAIGLVQAVDKLQPDPRFTEDDLRLAEAFAARAAIAVDLSQRMTKDALRRVVDAQEIERRRLARELHDEIGQDLTSLLLSLKTIEEAQGRDGVKKATGALRELVVTALQDVRRLAVELRPKALDDFGLVPALERLAQTFAEQTRMAIEVEESLGGARLPSDVETALYRIAQEALTNVVKHAQAQRVSVVLTRRGDRVALVVEDDGRGFDATVEHEGLGLLGMRERLELVRGRLEVESAEGSGTTLVAEVPL